MSVAEPLQGEPETVATIGGVEAPGGVPETTPAARAVRDLWAGEISYEQYRDRRRAIHAVSRGDVAEP